MARSTGPVLTVGAITFANQFLLDTKPPKGEEAFPRMARIVVGTGLAAAAFAGLERLWPQGATSLAWMALGTVLLTRIAGEPAPVERALDWWNNG